MWVCVVCVHGWWWANNTCQIQSQILVCIFTGIKVHISVFCVISMLKHCLTFVYYHPCSPFMLFFVRCLELLRICTERITVVIITGSEENEEDSHTLCSRGTWWHRSHQRWVTTTCVIIYMLIPVITTCIRCSILFWGLRAELCFFFLQKRELNVLWLWWVQQLWGVVPTATWELKGLTLYGYNGHRSSC